MSPDVSPVARRLAVELAENGAEAVVLVGSHARGEAGPDSDLDLLAVGDESYPPRLDVRDGSLVSVSVQPFDAHLESFALPELVCEAVPGRRDALVLHDPDGSAASLVEKARGWTWAPLERRCDAWVAEEITARAETVHKLVSARNAGRRSTTAAVKRYLIATRLARALAVHRRILYGSENKLWDTLAGEMGEGWGRVQAAATAGGDEGSVAALELYRMAAEEAWRLFDGRQRRVVERALSLAG